MTDAGASRPFRYAELAPPPALAAHVLSFWRFETRLAPGERALHHVWPDGCVSISVASAAGRALGAMVVGPSVEARRVTVEGGQTYAGVRFWPDTGALALGTSAATLRDRTVPVESLLGDALAPLLDAMATAPDVGATGEVLGAWLADRLARIPPPDARVRHAVQAIVATRGAAPIARIAAAVGLGPRQLQRRFRDAVGLTPKEFARVRRVRSAMGVVLDGEVRWSMVAAEVGYADQSHLIRDFGQLTGLTPGDVETRLARIEHDNVTP